MTDELNQILIMIKLLEFASFSTNSCKQIIQAKLKVNDFYAYMKQVQE